MLNPLLSRFSASLLLTRIGLLVGLLLSVGCAGVVRTQIHAFSGAPAEFTSGTIAVEAMDAMQGKTLEFARYRARLEHKLVEQGYQVVAPGEPHNLVAQLGYHVQETRGREHIRPGYMTHFRTSYYGPHTSLIVVDDGGRTEYLRTVNLVIARGADRQRLYEVTGVSQGRCPVLSVVFDEMLEALFTDFPIPDGTVHSVRVRGDTRC